MKKEKWTKPKLIVLIRNTEESVLAGCKGDPYGNPGPGVDLSGSCYETYCGYCSAYGES